MDRGRIRESAKGAKSGWRRIVPRTCLADSKQHIRTVRKDGLEARLHRPRWSESMLTRAFSAESPQLRSCRAVALAFALLGAPVMPAYAEGIKIKSCFGSFHSFFCVTQWGARGDPQLRQVPTPRDAEEEAEFVDRDRKWVARCRPVIMQDQYGVSRYHYASPHCEFGRIQD